MMSLTRTALRQSLSIVLLEGATYQFRLLGESLQLGRFEAVCEELQPFRRLKWYVGDARACQVGRVSL